MSRSTPASSRRCACWPGTWRAASGPPARSAGCTWFFWAYARSYNRLAAGFSRWQEYRADRVACEVVGAEAFVEALRKVCTEGGHFEQLIADNVTRLLRTDQAFVNLYLAFRQHRDAGPSHLSERLRRQLLAERPSPFASHPTFPERAAAATDPAVEVPRDERPARALLDRADAVEEELTDSVTHRLAGGG